MRIRILFFYLIVVPHFFLLGQDRVSEEEVNVQKLFIEASKEKLLERYDKAIELYEEIAKVDRNIPAVYYELCRLHLIKEDLTSAITEINKAIGLDPENIWYKKTLVEIYEKNGRFEEAAEVYEDIVKNSNKTINEDYFAWADLLIKANKLEEAIDVYDSLESITGFKEDVVRKIQSLYLQNGDTKKARKELEKLIDAFPAQVNYQELLAKFYEQFGEASKAKRIYEDILKIDPDNQVAKMALVGPTQNKKKSEGGSADLKTLFQRSEVDLQLKIEKLRELLSSLKSKMDPVQLNELLELSNILKEKYPVEAEVLLINGEVHWLKGQLEEAEGLLKKAVDIDDTVYRAWELYMSVLAQQKKYSTLAEVAGGAVDYFPNQISAYLYYGKAHIEENKAEDAIDYLNEAVFIAIDNDLNQALVHHLLANAYELKGNSSKSEDYRQKVLNSSASSDPTILEQFGDMVYLLGEAEEAVVYWKKSEQAGNNSSKLKTKILNRKLFK